MDGRTEAARTETQLIEEAREALHASRWILGDCAAEWCVRYASGRTDADFAALVGVSEDQVYKCRRVAEQFGLPDDPEAGGLSATLRNLSWSHFYVALNWEDAEDCLQWASDNDASIAEMRAWRRMQHGDDLTADADEEEPVEAVSAACAPAETPPLEPAVESVDAADAEYASFSPQAREPREAETRPALSGDAERARSCLSRITRAARELWQLGPSYHDLLRDHLDAVADAVRHGDDDPPEGLDTQTVRDLLSAIEGAT